MPSGTDESFSDTDFVVWVDADGNKYYVGEEYALADLNGKILTAYLSKFLRKHLRFSDNCVKLNENQKEALLCRKYMNF